VILCGYAPFVRKHVTREGPDRFDTCFTRM
jgi:hypothetical protein